MPPVTNPPDPGSRTGLIGTGGHGGPGRPARAALALLSCAALTACTTGVEDPPPVPAAPAAPAATAPVDLLPTAEEVSAAVGNPLDAVGEPRAGSIGVLPDGIRESSQAAPLECLGAVMPLMRVVYEAGDVQAAAWRDYSRFGQGLTASSAEVGVVRFSSAQEARRMFDDFAARWQSCAGTTVSLQPGAAQDGPALGLTLSDVRVGPTTVSATVLGDDAGRGAGYPTEHALGVAGEFLVDADVAITDPDPDKRVPAGRAAALVGVVLDEIS
jgi:hypothetical protein